MRPRRPGFYVAVRHGTEGVPGLPGLLLDGPWLSRESAQRRADRILQDAGRPTTTCRIVRVDDDGVTVHEVGDGPEVG